MRCDIHGLIEAFDAVSGTWKVIDIDTDIFDGRSYGLFGFLADVRNYSRVPPLAQTRGIPVGSNIPRDAAEDWDYHSHSWFLLSELTAFDYSKTFEDRRVTRVEGKISNGAALAEPGGGTITTFRDFLPEYYFEALEKLLEFAEKNNKGLEEIRIVFWFDS